VKQRTRSRRRKKPHTHSCTTHQLQSYSTPNTCWSAQDLFSDCGRVLGVHRNNKGKTIAYFPSRSAATKASKLNGTDFDGSIIRTSVLPRGALPPTAAFSPSSSSSSSLAGQVDEQVWLHLLCLNTLRWDTASR
jgi:hypothetical protein